MSLDLSAAVTTFLNESKELLQEMENGLIELESEIDDFQRKEIINHLFRAIHTIKGSAGIFGFNHVVDLTHIIETTLEQLKDAHIELDKEIVSTFLNSRDTIETLVSLAAEEKEPNDELLTEVNKQIATYSGYLDSEETDEQSQSTMSTSQVEDTNTRWHILFEPNEQVLKNGLDPFAFIYFLSQEVDNLEVDTDTEHLASNSHFDPETNYFQFHLCFDTDKQPDEILDVFDFILAEANVDVIPPNSHFKVIKAHFDAFSNQTFLIKALKDSKSLTDSLLTKLQGNDDQESDVEQQVLKQPSNVKSPAGNKLHQSKTLRVEALKLDRLIDQVGEMVITGARTNLLAHETGNETLIEAMALLERLVENIRDSSLKLRMVQIGETFNKFKRVVRDVAQELGKDVQLEIEGADTELDKTFVEKVSDPLMHIVRNAIDHGIETPEERVANGKPATGRLSLKAYHDSGSIVIEIKDDGQGLNKERILARAIERGIISAEQTLGEKDINLLIFEPGFSTAETVTNISGRGVGMDVVKRNIESLRGSVEVESTPGQGSSISIRLPLTLSIIDGFMFSVHDANYVIPLDTVVECLELHEVVSEEEIKDKNYINLRTEVLPFIRLRSLFGINERIDHTRESLVIVQFGTLRAGLVVDSLKGEFQTVVKPLGRLFEGLKCISGATILGSGNVAIILDVSALIKSAISVYESLEITQ